MYILFMKIKNILFALVGVAGIAWLIMFATTPPPGKQMPDQGRKHVTADEVAKFAFNSNPPTSGSHLESWVKPGVYKTPQSEGELIHSLEHGYVEINYNCNSAIVSRGASDDSGVATASATNETDACKTLIRQVEEIAKKKKLFKLLVVPRPTITSPIVLTAWTYILPLSGYDEKQIVKFIDYHRDHGPEQTME